MTSCAYCGQPATTKIAANPEDVCLAHAIEFWTGLLTYAKDRSGPCLKRERVCTCVSCTELTASQVRTAAIAAAGRTPAMHARRQMRLAS